MVVVMVRKERVSRRKYFLNRWILVLCLSIVSILYYLTVWTAPEESETLALLREGKPQTVPKAPPITSLANESSVSPILKKNMHQRQECLVKIRQRQNQILRPLLSSHDHVLLIDPAYHSNVGDYMITLGEQLILTSTEYSECSYVQGKDAPIPPCSTAIPELASRQNNLALWHGGGNWGDLWPTVQAARIESLSMLVQHNYTIVGMPQSLFFTKNNTSSKQQPYAALQEGFQKLHSSIDKQTWFQNRVTLLWREHESLQMAEQLYPFVSHRLVPDSAFQLGPYFGHQQIPPSLQVDIVLLLRRDHETKLPTEWQGKKGIRQYLSQTYPQDNIKFSVVDWPDRHERFNDDSQSHGYLDEAALKLLRMGRVVIVNRLHAAILAYQLGLPIIYLDPVSGKISKTLHVALEGCSSDKYLVPSESMPQALNQAVQWLKVMP